MDSGTNDTDTIMHTPRTFRYRCVVCRSGGIEYIIYWKKKEKKNDTRDLHNDFLALFARYRLRARVYVACLLYTHCVLYIYIYGMWSLSSLYVQICLDWFIILFSHSMCSFSYAYIRMLLMCDAYVFSWRRNAFIDRTKWRNVVLSKWIIIINRNRSTTSILRSY